MIFKKPEGFLSLKTFSLWRYFLLGVCVKPHRTERTQFKRPDTMPASHPFMVSIFSALLHATYTKKNTIDDAD
jgi:hypothetical protein